MMFATTAAMARGLAVRGAGGLTVFLRDGNGEGQDKGK